MGGGCARRRAFSAHLSGVLKIVFVLFHQGERHEIRLQTRFRPHLCAYRTAT